MTEEEIYHRLLLIYIESNLNFEDFYLLIDKFNKMIYYDNING